MSPNSGVYGGFAQPIGYAKTVVARLAERTMRYEGEYEFLMRSVHDVSATRCAGDLLINYRTHDPRRIPNQMNSSCARHSDFFARTVR